MRDVVPEKILSRKDKMGFATPEFSWLIELNQDFKSYFSHDLDDYVNVSRLLDDWDRLMQKQLRSDMTKMWRFVNFAIWKNVYNL
jgi:asparagine synthase (glutamine-hydrolysing)